MKSLSWFTLIVAPVAAAAAPAVQPAAPRWVADWGEGKCSLSREAGPVALSLQFAPGTEGFELRAVDLRWKDAPLRAGQQLGISLDGRAAATIAAATISGKGLNAVTGERLTRDFVVQFAKASTVRLDVEGRRLVELAIPAAAKAVEALLACEEDALRGWGIDPADRAPVKTLPQAHKNLAALVINDDYPPEALRKEEQGTVRVRLMVGPDGRVGECRLLGSSGSAALDKKTCAVFRERARFDPATDAQGKPTKAYVVTHLTWRIFGG